MRCTSSPLSQRLAKRLSLKEDEKSCHLGNETSSAQETMDKSLTGSSFIFMNRSSLVGWWEFIQWDLTWKVNFTWEITHRFGRGAM